MINTVSQSKNHFRLRNRTQFLLGDTIWSAFTHPTEEEWEEYVDFRKEQGFNALQMNVLQQRHSGEPKEWRHPFAVTDDGHYDYSRINEPYFHRACSLVGQAVEKGMLPMLVLLWGNYIPGTWQGKRDAGREEVTKKPYYLPMSEKEMEDYVTYTANIFKQYNPVFIISGDTDFVEESVPYYKKALEITKKCAPECLTTLHIIPGEVLPDCLTQAPELDFYMYQPGHKISERALDKTLARQILSYPVRRPVVNSETSYEGNVYFDEKSGRFDERQIRRSFWRGVLSGATAGFVYGAGGVWLWKEHGRRCSITDHTGLVNDWRMDLHLPGAWDVSYGKWLAEQVGMLDFNPADIVVNDPCEEAVAAAADDFSCIAVYTSFAFPLEIALDLSQYCVEVMDLEKRRVLSCVMTYEEGKTLVSGPSYNHDFLYIFRKSFL